MQLCMVLMGLTSTEKAVLTVNKTTVYIWGRGRNNLLQILGEENLISVRILIRMLLQGVVYFMHELQPSFTASKYFEGV